MKVFLGGTCNDSTWRDELIPLLRIDYFNPVVEDWTPEDQEEELRQRELCDICLYVITPKMAGVYSIAEVVDDSNKNPGKTAFAVIFKDGNQKFEQAQMKSLQAVGDMVRRNGGFVIETLSANPIVTIADALNSWNHKATTDYVEAANDIIGY